MHELITTAGYTILHSLWQGTLLAALLWALSRLTHWTAARRYRAGLLLLMAQPLLSLLTVLHYTAPAPAPTHPVPTHPATIAELPSVFVGWLHATNETVTLNWTDYALLLTVGLWLLSMVIGSLRLGIALHKSRRLRRQGTRPAPAALQDILTNLCHRLGLRHPPLLRLSERVSTPSLLGHLRPVLLLPVATINQLSLEETEAVLLHELAHLRRYDHWLNLLQCLVEVVYYYHPAVHWIGRRLREERECCCDDLVLAHGPGRLPYARALLRFEEHRAQLALALTDGGVLARLRRITLQTNHHYRMQTRLFLLPILALVTVVVSAMYHEVGTESNALYVAEEVPELLVIAAAPESKQVLDTLPDGDHEITKITNGKTTRLKVSNGEIQELEIDGRVVPPSEFDEHEELAEELLDVRPLRRGRRYRGPLWHMDNDSIADWQFDFSADSARIWQDLGRARVDMDSAFQHLKVARFNFERMDMDSVQRELAFVMQDLDSLQRFNFGLDSFRMNFQPPQMEFFNIRPGTLEELDREEARLREALRRLEERREELEN